MAGKVLWTGGVTVNYKQLQPIDFTKYGTDLTTGTAIFPYGGDGSEPLRVYITRKEVISAKA